MKTWINHFKSQRGTQKGSASYFLEQHFRFLGIKDPTDEDVANIPEDELATPYISVATMKEILVFQQEYGKD